MSELTKRFSPRMIALFGLVAVAVLIGVLLYLEFIAVLYVLATLALVGLLLVVAFDDLEKVDRDASGFSSEERK